ncbi:MAG: hypothetical protein M3220_00265 [Chloroflexota bacterium]|nr:hypothetical protein [Chloroflexota bacterium]
MNSASKWIITVAVGALAVLLAVGANVVSAQEPGSGAILQQVLPLERAGIGGLGLRGWHEEVGNYNELLADALDITVEELEAAQQAAYEAMLEQAVAEGQITEEQAELLAARQALKQYVEQEALLAEVLGMSVEELEEARDAGESWSEILEAQGLDGAELHAALQDAYEEAVQDAVEDGVITEEQADQILSSEGVLRFRGLRGFGRNGLRSPDATPEPELDGSEL